MINIKLILNISTIKGTDYNDLQDTVVFLPGEDSVVINLSPIQDGLDEGFEVEELSMDFFSVVGMFEEAIGGWTEGLTFSSTVSVAGIL